MKVWINNTFKGYWPVGTAVVIVAKTKKRAERILKLKLESMKLYQDDESRLIVKELPVDVENIMILQDGNY